MKKFCKQHIGIFVIGLFVCALSSNLITGFLQNMFAGNIVQYYWIEAVCKYVIAALPLTLMVKWGYIGKSNAKKIGLGFLIGAVLILFCLPNIIPFMFIDSMYMIVSWKTVFAIFMACFAIGLMEEAGIRGVFLPLLYEKWSEKKHAYTKAAIVTSLVFGCIHLNWNVRYLLVNGVLPLDQLLGNLYQVYYTFCFGIFTAGVTIYTRSILPMVFWHGMCDLAARFPNGLYPQSTLEYFVQKNWGTLQFVLDKFGIVVPEVVFHAMIDLILLIVGFLLIRKVEKATESKI